MRALGAKSHGYWGLGSALAGVTPVPSSADPLVVELFNTQVCSSRTSSKHQKGYGEVLHIRCVYPPQMVIEGAAETVGSKRPKVERLLQQAHFAQKLGVRLLHTDHAMIHIEAPGGGGCWA